MIVGFCGLKQTGKDTAGGFLVARGFTRYAFADKLRDVCYSTDPYVQVPWRLWSLCGGPFARLSHVVDTAGWDAAKVHIPDVRRLLERLATDGVRNNLGDSVWLDAVMRDIDARPDHDAVITDVRFVNEAQAIRERGGIIIGLSAPGRDTSTGHVSDQGLPDEWVDARIVNPLDDTFESLVMQAISEHPYVSGPA